ncbi:MAG: valine--tRNA ligase [Gammaproteobacteria bacterium]|nr:MAG: valine--tRNA ligase [Gammaproteobacteria bacterium]
MEKSYQPAAIEGRWYRSWEEAGYFSPAEQGQPYCIMLPPPNVTGNLHMGHAFQDTIMDVLTRFHRMQGNSALWQTGMDHAGIATQMVVERQLADDGITRHDLGRDKFVEAVWDWKHSSGGMIARQMRRLGASVDWDHDRFTMDEDLSRAVMKVFVELFHEGLIYRGKRLVNWDPVLHTALSDLEVISEDENGYLWHIRYPRVDGKGYIVVATTRPETMLGDTAVAVNPQDPRYADLVGLELELPLTGRSIPVISDSYVDINFGSGCVKVTPAHDFNDYEMGKRHQLQVINVLNDDATINNQAPEAYQGLDRFDARKQIVADLEAACLLEKTENHRLMIPRGDRSGAVIEPYLTDQWYVKIAPLAKPAIEAVENGKIRFIPENWNKTYFDWMHRIEDWCISRQLWWGHRIPAWYDAEGNIYVGYDETDARKRGGIDEAISLQQDEDVLDTWFSSALWPFSTLGWPDKTPRLEKYYPTNVLVTGFDIIFFWVARMIMMGLKFMDDVPFREVYIHGLIRDSHGQKMSKSKGNVLDPIDLIDGIELEPLVKKRTSGLMQPHLAPAIEKATRKDFPDGLQAFGCDALRFTFAALATNGRDIRFDLGRIEGNRNFCNKLWNAARFVLMSTSDYAIQPVSASSAADRWIISRLYKMTGDVRGHFNEYRLDLAARRLHQFFWNEYCDWYLELSKPVLLCGSSDEKNAARYTLLHVLESSLRVLHPIMPFITEEIWQRLRKPLALKGESIMLQAFPEAGDADQQAEDDIAWLQQVVQGIRNIRAELNVAPAKPLAIAFQSGQQSDRDRQQRFAALLESVGKISSSQWLDDNADTTGYSVALVADLKVLVSLQGLVDVEDELARLGKLLERELADLKRSAGKLKNSRFVKNAPPAVVEQEHRRLATHKTKVTGFKTQMEKLEKLQE